MAYRPGKAAGKNSRPRISIDVRVAVVGVGNVGTRITRQLVSNSAVDAILISESWGWSTYLWSFVPSDE